ncbi:unnamed protein product, partial [Closterium sp. NIES-53]
EGGAGAAPAVHGGTAATGFELNTPHHLFPLPLLPTLPQSFDAVRAELEQLPSDTVALQQLGMHSGRRLLQLDVITEQLATQVMNHHQKMVQGMQLVGELDRELRVVSVICRNARRHLNKAMEQVASDLVVAASVNKKKMLTVS